MLGSHVRSHVRSHVISAIWNECFWKALKCISLKSYARIYLEPPRRDAADNSSPRCEPAKLAPGSEPRFHGLSGLGSDVHEIDRISRRGLVAGGASRPGDEMSRSATPPRAARHVGHLLLLEHLLGPGPQDQGGEARRRRQGGRSRRRQQRGAHPSLAAPRGSRWRRLSGSRADDDSTRPRRFLTDRPSPLDRPFPVLTPRSLATARAGPVARRSPRTSPSSATATSRRSPSSARPGASAPRRSTSRRSTPTSSRSSP